MVNEALRDGARWMAVLLCAFFAVSPGGVAARSKRPPADIIITNARIYTVNPGQPWAEAVAIQDGRILAVGSSGTIARYRGPSTRLIDAQQHLLLPGLTNAHIHFYEGSISLTRLSLDEEASLTQIQQSVKEYAAAHPELPWIIGRGWSYPAFGAAGMPHKRFLDEVVPDRPVFLVGFDGHSYWANSKALALAGVGPDTPDPTNGTVVRDEHGELTGGLKEDAAADLVRRVIPESTREQKLAALRRGLHEANRFGLVRVHGASGEGESSDFAVLDLLENLRRDGELTVRFYTAYHLDPAEPLSTALEHLQAARQQYQDEWISTGAVKTYLDGVIETHTAAMLAPYADDPSQRGKLFWDPDKYKAAVTELDRRGFQVFTHAIGDRAVRLALDAYEQAAKSNRTADARHRVEHIETIAPSDIARFGGLGVIASFQPLHASPNDDTLNVWARNAGPDRSSRGWAWHSIAASGGRLAFGSDWPVVTLNPWEGLQNAVTRQTWEGTPPGGWLPEQRVSLEEAIKAYTLGASVAGRREKTEGSIAPGKVADFILASQDVFKIDPHRIRETDVLFTMVGGKVVYQSPAWGDRAPVREEKQ